MKSEPNETFFHELYLTAFHLCLVCASLGLLFPSDIKLFISVCDLIPRFALCAVLIVAV